MRRSAPVVYVEAFDARYCVGVPELYQRRARENAIERQGQTAESCGKEGTHEVRRLEFLDVARPSEDRLLIQDIFNRLIRRTHRRVKEPTRRRGGASARFRRAKQNTDARSPGRDGVDPRKVAPIPRERPAKVNDRRLGRVVRGLVVRDVDDPSRDARRRDERAGPLRLEDAGALARGVERRVQVDALSLVPRFEGIVWVDRAGNSLFAARREKVSFCARGWSVTKKQHTPPACRSCTYRSQHANRASFPPPALTHVGDVAVQPSKVLLDRLDRLLDRLVLGHFALVRLDLDAEPLRQLGGPLLHVGCRAVQQRDVATCFGDRFRCGETDPAAATGDGRHFALHAKHAAGGWRRVRRSVL